MTYLLVTRGDAGGFDDTPRDQMPALREAEQRAAAAAVGVTDVDFLDGYADGSRHARRSHCAATSPGRSGGSGPTGSSPTHRCAGGTASPGPSHPDHLAVGEATTCAIYPDARNAFAFPELLRDEGLEPWVVREIWFSGGPDARSRRRHHRRLRRASSPRCERTPRRPATSIWRRACATDARRRRHAAAGLPEGRLAEAFTSSRPPSRSKTA